MWGLREGDNERLNAMKSRLWLERFLSPEDLEAGTAELAGQLFTNWATGAPHCFRVGFETNAQMETRFFLRSRLEGDRRHMDHD